MSRRASRSRRDPDERARLAYNHALDVTKDAIEYGSAREAPRPWLRAADAWEVAADAFEEAGLPEKANQANASAHNIYETIRYGYEPKESRELYRERRRRAG